MNAPVITDFNQPDTLDRVALDALEIAAAGGSADVEVAVTAGEGFDLTVRDGTCETIEYQRDKSLGVTLYLEGRKGSATTSDFSATALKKTIDAARLIAEYGEVDEFAGLADARYLAREVVDLELDHPWDIDAAQAIELAITCERAALAADKRIKQSDGASVSRYQGTRAYANSHGFHGAYRGTRHGLSAVMIAAEDDGAMQTGYWYASGRDASHFDSAEIIGVTAAQRAAAKLGARKIATTELPVIFEPRLAAGLIGHLVSAISGSSQYRRASFLLDALGETVMPRNLSLEERPHLRGAIGSAPFDGDGVATADKTVVQDGRLQSYLLSAYAARRLGREPTGNAGGPHNLVLTPGKRNREDLIASLERGLLVTDLMGFGVNGVTGDYSRGASGFLIEGGEISHAVEEITIAGNLRSILTGINEVGSDVDESLRVRTGSILIDRMAVAGS